MTDWRERIGALKAIRAPLILLVVVALPGALLCEKVFLPRGQIHPAIAAYAVGWLAGVTAFGIVWARAAKQLKLGPSRRVRGAWWTSMVVLTLGLVCMIPKDYYEYQMRDEDAASWPELFTTLNDKYYTWAHREEALLLVALLLALIVIRASRSPARRQPKPEAAGAQ